MSLIDHAIEGSGAAHHLFGRNDIEAMFPEGRPISAVPWERNSRRKDRQDYDKGLVHAELSRPVGGASGLVDIDPRTLRATQPSVTRAGVEHYLGGQWEKTGETFADHSNVGNRYPFVYAREDGQNLLLSGHHRASAALLQGRPLRARRIEGPWGPGR